MSAKATLQDVVHAMRDCAIRTKAMSCVEFRYQCYGPMWGRNRITNEFAIYVAKFEHGVTCLSDNVTTPEAAVAFFAAGTPIDPPVSIADVTVARDESIEAAIERAGVLSVQEEIEEITSTAGDSAVTQKTKTRTLNRTWIAVDVAAAKSDPCDLWLNIGGHAVHFILSRVDYANGCPAVAYYDLRLAD